MVIEQYDFSNVNGDPNSIKETLISYFNERTLSHFAETGFFLNPLKIYLEIPKCLQKLNLSQQFPHSQQSQQFPHSQQSPRDTVSRELSPEKPETSEINNDLIIDNKDEPGLCTNVNDRIMELLRTTMMPTKHETNKSSANITTLLRDPTIIQKFSDFVDKNYEHSKDPGIKFGDLLRDFHTTTGMFLGDKWHNRDESLCNSLNIRVEKVLNPNSYYRNSGTYHAYLKVKLGSCKEIPILSNMSK